MYEYTQESDDIAVARFDNGQSGTQGETATLVVARMPRNKSDYIDTGRTTYQWEVWLDGALSESGRDVYTGVGSDDGPLAMLATVADFLCACGESYWHSVRTGQQTENYDLFSAPVREWAYQFSDELAMLRCEIEEDNA